MHREDFKIFDNYFNKTGSRLVYLDSAATSQTPTYVLDAMNNYYTNYRSNIDRGVYDIAEQATTEYESSREVVAKFIGAKVEDIIFTAGSTASSNLLSLMFERDLNQAIYSNKNEILVTVNSHHSEMLPLQEYANRNGLKFKIVKYEDLYNSISNNTLIVSVPLASNVTGEIFDIEAISKKTKSTGSFLICDLSAAVGHIDVDVNTLGVDAAYFSAHKMCGPTGVGVLYLRREISRDMKPVYVGGGVVWEVNDNSSTYRSDIKAFEAGTGNIAGVIGLKAAIEYINNIGLNNIRQHIKDLYKYTLTKLSTNDNLILHTTPINNVGIISFEYNNVHPHDVATVLGKDHVCVRAGHHCAAPLMRDLEVKALVRLSLYIYNDETDIDIMIDSLNNVKKTFK